MEPLSLLLLGGVGISAVASGYIWGRSGGRSLGRLDLADDETTRRLQAELSAVRRLAGLHDVKDALRSSAAGESEDLLRELLGQVYACKPTRAAGFFDREGLLRAGSEGDDATRLGAWVSRAVGLEDAAVRSVEVRTAQGDVLRADRIVLPATSQTLWLGVWSASEPVAEVVYGRVRYALSQRIETDSEPATGVPLMLPASASIPAATVLARIAQALPLQSIALLDDSSVVFERGAGLDAKLRRSCVMAGATWGHPELAPDETMRVDFGDERGAYGLHRYVNREGQSRLLVLGTRSGARFAWSRINAWSAALANTDTTPAEQPQSVREGA